MAKAAIAHNEPGARREDAMIVVAARDGKTYFDQKHQGRWKTTIE
ncbi:MAG TPA: hypothetical protein VN936_10830 [Candidatus Acidoferrum sp.]|jgi:hypothetical protein|nr:hypothetical protein [Candidatus Acidoferrum sp.]